MTDNQRPAVEFPGDALARIVVETQATISTLSQSADPVAREFAQKLQVILNNRTGR